MSWLNYHHLLYFTHIVREGSLSQAARHLRLTHSTLSTQLKALEDALGGALFERRGRRLVLTPLGELVQRYADEISRLGSELLDVVHGQIEIGRAPLRVGVIGSLPRSIVYQLVEPAVGLPDTGPLQLHQDTLPRLLEALAASRLHVVLADTPPGQGGTTRLHAHALGQSEVLLYGAPRLARRFGPQFPGSLSGAPLLLPSAQTGLRRLIDRYLVDHGLTPRIAGEFDDAGLLRVFGGNGLGLFPVLTALRTEVEERHGARCLGVMEGVHERYYAISQERRVRHLGVAAIIESARTRLASAS
jgi:LysR family transcriptional activator of nhaA